MEIFLRFPSGKAKALTLSYDDGVIYDQKLIEIMQKYGVKGTFNINSGLFGQGRRLSEEQVKSLYQNSGMEVAIHGLYHFWPNALHGTQIYKEFITDKENLENLFGGVVRGMAYAQGVYTDEVINALKEIGIVYGRTVTDNLRPFDLPTDWLTIKPTCKHTSPRLKELTNLFIDTDPDKQRNKQPMMFYLWGHSYEFEDANNWGLIEDFCKTVGNREDIWYATNIEIYDYVKAFDSLAFSVDGTKVYNPSATDVYLRVGGTTCVAYAGKTTKIR